MQESHERICDANELGMMESGGRRYLLIHVLPGDAPDDAFFTHEGGAYSLLPCAGANGQSPFADRLVAGGSRVAEQGDAKSVEPVSAHA